MEKTNCDFTINRQAFLQHPDRYVKYSTYFQELKKKGLWEKYVEGVRNKTYKIPVLDYFPPQVYFKTRASK